MLKKSLEVGIIEFSPTIQLSTKTALLNSKVTPIILFLYNLYHHIGK